MANKIYNIILIGCGYWGKNYIKLLTNLSDKYNFIGIAELNQDIINNIKKTYPNINIYKNYKEAFDLVDICIVATPISTHYSIIKSCLENNKHVIVEKPFTNSYEKSLELNNIAKKNNLHIFVNFTPIYTNPYSYIYDNYKNKLNDVFYINCIRTNLGIIRSDCNVIYDLTCHDIAMVIYLLDELPDENSIKISTKKCYSDNVDIAFINMNFPKNNILCSFYTSWVDNKKERSFTIVSKNDKLIYNDIDTINSIKINKSNIQKDIDNFIYNQGDTIIPIQIYNEPLRNQLEHYHECLTQNIKCKTDSEFALKVDKILQLINSKI